MELECFVDQKGVGVDSRRYTVAVQELEIKAVIRTIQGVLFICIMRSVVILEPMAGLSKDTREKVEIPG